MVMRLSEFDEKMRTRFGAYADSVLRDLVLGELDGRTGADALEAGVDPRRVWQAVCRAKEVPPKDR